MESIIIHFLEMTDNSRGDDEQGKTEDVFFMRLSFFPFDVPE